MKSLFRERLRERTLDAMDWVDIRPDPHWGNYMVAPGVVALCWYFVPEGFLPLFFILCICAAIAATVAFVVLVGGTVVYRASRDVISAQLARARKVVQEAGPIVIQREAL